MVISNFEFRVLMLLECLVLHDLLRFLSPDFFFQYPVYPNHVMQQLHQQHLQHHMLPKYWSWVVGNFREKSDKSCQRLLSVSWPQESWTVEWITRNSVSAESAWSNNLVFFVHLLCLVLFCCCSNGKLCYECTVLSLANSQFHNLNPKRMSQKNWKHFQNQE